MIYHVISLYKEKIIGLHFSGGDSDLQECASGSKTTMTSQNNLLRE
jgi:hypothetical protein